MNHYESDRIARPCHPLLARDVALVKFALCVAIITAEIAGNIWLRV